PPPPSRKCLGSQTGPRWRGGLEDDDGEALPRTAMGSRAHDRERPVRQSGSMAGMRRRRGESARSTMDEEERGQRHACPTSPPAGFGEAPPRSAPPAPTALLDPAGSGE